jgi:hypothetical protein
MASNARYLLRTTLLSISAAASFLAAPGPARAEPITAERALLNRAADAREAAAFGQGRVESVSVAGERAAIDGERALLNRQAVTADRPDRSATAHATLFRASRGGASALLNHATL